MDGRKTTASKGKPREEKQGVNSDLKERVKQTKLKKKKKKLENKQ